MKSVFADAIMDSAARGVKPMVWRCIHEILDLPVILLREYFSAFRDLKKEAKMSPLDANLNKTEPLHEKRMSWMEVLLGTMPFAL